MSWISKPIRELQDKVSELKEKMDFFNFREFVNQRQNKRMPSASCNVSAVINCMVEAQIPIMFRKSGERPADTLMTLCQSPWGWEQLRRIDRNSEAHPWNYSEILGLAVNKLQGQDIAQRAYISGTELKPLLLKNTVLIGGTFAGLGHIICVHGVQGEYFVCDDSWGNARTGYRDHNGDDVLYPIKDLIQWCFYNENWKKGKTYILQFARW